MTTEQNQTEAEQLFAALYEKHKDILDPIIRRINDCTISHSGDDVFYIYQFLIQTAQAIKEMIQAGTVIPSTGPEARSKMN